MGEEAAQRGFSDMANRMKPSSILTIAAEIRELKEAGAPVADLTVGDFNSQEFPIPHLLRDYLQEAVEAGETNYPPAPGHMTLRKAVVAHFKRTAGLDYPVESTVIFGGARPGLYSVYRLLLNEGERVLYPVPSWNNTNFRDICDVEAVVMPCSPENAFQPTADAVAERIGDVRMVVLNSPQNPSGGVLPPEEMERIGRILCEENERRNKAGEKPVYLMLDQIYRLLVFPGSEHVSPVQLVPECAPYVIHIDGISKICAATGLRVGWMVGPPAIARKITALLTHVGAWAPRPAQIAAARFMDNPAGLDAWAPAMVAKVEERLALLYRGLRELGEAGLPVQVIAPQGALYTSVRFDLAGKRTSEGERLESDGDVRSFLTQAAGFALVPFSAFGVPAAEEDGWFRASVGAVSRDDIRNAIPRLKAVLGSVQD